MTENNGGFWKGLGNLLAFGLILYAGYSMATSKNPFVRLIFWAILIWMGYEIYKDHQACPSCY
jgi:hypothetical protein